eukprot:scaffold34802_cov87-Phaeocystis_antarctica.AAC.1
MASVMDQSQGEEQGQGRWPRLVGRGWPGLAGAGRGWPPGLAGLAGAGQGWPGLAGSWLSCGQATAHAALPPSQHRLPPSRAEAAAPSSSRASCGSSPLKQTGRAPSSWAVLPELRLTHWPGLGLVAGSPELRIDT